MYELSACIPLTDFRQGSNGQSIDPSLSNPVIRFQQRAKAVTIESAGQKHTVFLTKLMRSPEFFQAISQAC